MRCPPPRWQSGRVPLRTLRPATRPPSPMTHHPARGIGSACPMLRLYANCGRRGTGLAVPHRAHRGVPGAVMPASQAWYVEIRCDISGKRAAGGGALDGTAETRETPRVPSCDGPQDRSSSTDQVRTSLSPCVAIGRPGPRSPRTPAGLKPAGHLQRSSAEPK